MSDTHIVKEQELQLSDNTALESKHESGPLEILRQAVELGRDADTVQRLLDMRKQLKDEWAQEQFFGALAEFQAELPDIPKTKKVLNKDKKSVRYSYAPLDVIVKTVKPLLLKHGFSYTMKPTQQDAQGFTSVIVVHHKEGHSEETSFTVPLDNEAYMNAPQKVGSARTFSMRYAFCNAFGILTSDEDNDSMSVDAGIKYASYIAELESKETIKELQGLARRYHEELGLQNDEDGQAVILSVYNRLKEQLKNE